jgi:predicted nucleotidyltransferase
MKPELKELVSRLEKGLNDRLMSVVLYGSAAAGESDAVFSDLNVLCVLKQITPRELGEAETVLRWWRDQGHPSPLMMTEDEVSESADSFPIEFRDMKERRQVLYGLDVISELHVDTRHHRTMVEHELRSKLLRLRQQGARLLSDPQQLLLLCLDSVTTFVVLARHAIFACGQHPHGSRHHVLRQLGEAAKVDMTPLETLIAVREDRADADPGDPGELFAQYLQAIEGMIHFVDRLEGEKR